VAEREAKRERERLLQQRRDAKGKPTVTREHVDVLMDAMTHEGRAHVIMQATHRLRIQPATWPK
jgi:hypothetical protein